MSTEIKNYSLYRGKCQALENINKVDIDISALVEESTPMFDGEPARKFFPVRSQITWFRLKNGDLGIISPEIIQSDEFRAIIKATVIIDGVPVSSAHGSADAATDGVSGFKLIETAESRAIARALDFAGYGCQLNLKTFDESSTDSEEAQDGGTPSGSPKQDKEIPENAPGTVLQPGTMSGSCKVDANAPSQVIDIHDLEAAGDAVKPKSTRGRKGKAAQAGAESAAAEKTVEEPVSSSVDSVAAQPVTPENTQTLHQAEPVQDIPAELPSDTAQAPADDNLPEETAAAAGISAPAPQPEPESLKSPEEKIWSYIESQNFSAAPPSLDPRFFGGENRDPDKVFINDGNPTKMLNQELQFALDYLQEHPDVIYDLRYPASKGAFAGKTFGEICAMDQQIPGGNVAAQAIESCKKLYLGKKAPLYAAVLLLAEQINA